MVPPGSSAFFWRGGLGNWFVTMGDGIAMDAPIDTEVAADGTSNKAYHVSGMGDGVSVDLWAQLSHPSGEPVNLSAYGGISFKARGFARPLEPLMRFNADGQPDKNDAPPPRHGFLVVAEWRTFSLSFADAHTPASAISSIDFVVESPDEPFDLWIDDLTFRCLRGCP